MKQDRYRRIVCPIDGSGWAQRAVPHAVDIARSNGSQLILLHIMRPPAHEFADQVILGHQESQLEEGKQQVVQFLEGLKAELNAENINVQVQLIEGHNVAELICDYINSEKVDLVVMSTHGRTGIARFLFGSVAHKVVQEVKVPVLLIHPDKD